MIFEVLNVVKAQFPRYPEEGSDASLIARNKLHLILLQAHTSASEPFIEAILDLVENVLKSLCLNPYVFLMTMNF